MKTRKERKTRRRRTVRGALATLFAFAVLVVATGAGAFLYGKWQFERPGPLQEEATVMIERGVGTAEIARRLEEAGAISDARLFLVAALATENAGRLKAGEYAIPAGASMADVMARLADGKAIVRKLTIPEGLTSAQIVERVRAEQALSGEIAAVPPEGTLLPETYIFHRGDDRQRLIDRMRAAHEGLVEELWAKRDRSIAVKTPGEAIILASIVEKETGIPEERPEVAAVFHNRLKRNMRLQSDPTIIYGLSGGNGALGRAITKSDIDKRTDYNTYQIDGLPPTPIANPGRAALEAVLNPADSKAVYFVADGTGGHVFAETLAEHRQNVRRWRAIERQREAEQPASAPAEEAAEPAATEPEAEPEAEPEVATGEQQAAADSATQESAAAESDTPTVKATEPETTPVRQAEIAAVDVPESGAGEAGEAMGAVPPTPKARPEAGEPNAGTGDDDAAGADAADADAAESADEEPERLVLRSVPLPRPKPAQPSQ